MSGSLLENNSITMHGNMNARPFTLRTLRQKRHVTPYVSDDQILFTVNIIWSPCVCKQVRPLLQPFIHFSIILLYHPKWPCKV